MKLKRRELALLLPSVGLLGLGVAITRPRVSAVTSARPTLQLHVASTPSKYFGGDFAVVNTRVSAHLADPRRVYFNCRLEGMMNGRSQVFYSSGGFDPFACWSKTSRSEPLAPAYSMRQVFRLSGLPAGASRLFYRIEAVALGGAPADPQEVTLGELRQARQRPGLLGYGSASTPLVLPSVERRREAF